MYLFILQLSLKVGKEESVPVCHGGSSFLSASEAGTRQWDKVLFRQRVVRFALLIMQHVLGFLLLSAISYIPRELYYARYTDD